MTSKTRTKLSSHFVATEFDCHDGTQWPPGARDALELWAKVWGEPLRKAFGPVRIASGYRTASYNAGVGGAPSSYHIYSLRYDATGNRGRGVGVAADCIPARGTPADWQKWALRNMAARSWPLGGERGACVAYPESGFIHLDTGPRRTWAG